MRKFHRGTRSAVAASLSRFVRKTLQETAPERRLNPQAYPKPTLHLFPFVVNLFYKKLYDKKLSCRWLSVTLKVIQGR